MITFQKINSLKELDLNIYDFSYWSSLEENDYKDIYNCYKNNNLIGTIHYTIVDKCLTINMIEVIDKNKGYGKLIISQLFNNFSIDIIDGQAISEAIPFWESVGADFDWKDIEEREEALDSSSVFYFTIFCTKNSL